MHDEEHQANPTELPDVQLAELRETVKRTVTVLNENTKTVHRWFWKLFIAFNLVLASWVFWHALPRLLPL
ncbi:hypothetical protein [Blastopirellula marina]|uniref:Uncharacterized protein n=1 Tax=Blastopirellula marina TaxID=124 RepID=A0A2S8GTI9_9BACT|nr:hypothetical protein [Blastopirellula marina]PQO47384.1 hypothetical protein C5Y93_04900 [Blastopirellula marina]